MEINGRKIKAIRPMTKDELDEYTRNRSSMFNKNPIFCIEFEDSTILLPHGNCLNCMQNNNCLFSHAYLL
jgi:hypothetical protein